MAYASKYYDPVKAHEYYMRTRQLKGRRPRSSTAELNDQGKSAAKVVKENVDKEYKKTLEQTKKDYARDVQNFKDEVSKMTKHERRIYKHRLEAEYKKLSDNLKRKKEALKAEYKEIYLKELDSMKTDKALLKPVKKTKRKGTKS